MTITTTTLTRTAGVAAVLAGLLFITVQIGHPHLDVAFATTSEYLVRHVMKILVAALSLVGITGMYLRQVREVGVLGLLGYVLFSAAYLLLLSVEVIGAVVLPAIADTSPDYLRDVFAVTTGGTAESDIGLIEDLSKLVGFGFVVGGVVFGIALFRARLLARWAAALLAVSTAATVLAAVLPQVNFRLFAIPVGIALIGLGHSLWREQRTAIALPRARAVNAQLDLTGAP